MNAKRILKEARPLFWPWCSVIFASSLPLIRQLHSIYWISTVGFFLGLPLLATLPLGNEFQHRTLSLLLSQPIGRMKIWGEKLCVTIAAVVSVVLVSFFSLRITPTLPKLEDQAIVAALIVAIVASATFWTLLARSTVGGIALSVGALCVIVMSLSFAHWLSGIDRLSPTNYTVVLIATILCYAGSMLWLGQRMLSRFQVTGDMASDDLLTAGPDLMPEALADRLRSRPSGAVLNLIRKELRLQRPVWLITLFTAPGWTCLTVFELLRERGPSTALPIAAVVLGMSCAAIIAILAGCLSLGEEKTSGTYAWHRTLPVSARRQWLIKLFVAQFVGLVCAGLLPVLLMIAGKFLFGSPFILEGAHFQILWLVGVFLLTTASFWCACVVNGTVTAVLWVSPILIAVTLVPEIGNLVGEKCAYLIASNSNLFANFRFAAAVSNIKFRFGVGLYTTSELLVVWVPTLILAVIQSYRLFRTPVQDRTLSVVRKLLPLLMLAFLCSFSLSAFDAFADQAKYQLFVPIESTNQAIENVLSDGANREATHPLQLTPGDLGNAYPFPEGSRGWLRNSRITVIPDEARPAGYCCIEWNGRRKTLWNYTATIHLASGPDLTLSIEPREEPSAAGPGWMHRPFLTVRVRWPGTAGDEPLWR